MIQRRTAIRNEAPPFQSHALGRRLVLLLALAASGSAAAPVHELDGFVVAAMERWAIPGLAVAVVKDNEIVFAKGYGVRQIGRPDRVDENTSFGIGSVTKSFTAAGAAMLVDEGKLAWDAPIIDYISSLHFSDPWITLTLPFAISSRTVWVSRASLATIAAGISTGRCRWRGT